MEQLESELLSAYVDGELGGKDLALVQERLAQSSEWRQELKYLQSAKNLTTSLPRVSAPPDLIYKLEEQAQEHVLAGGPTLWDRIISPWMDNRWMMGGSLATAATFLLTIGIYQTHQRSFIPLEPLIAVHSNGHCDSLLQGKAMTAADHSAQVKRLQHE